MNKIKIDTSFKEVNEEALSKLEMLHIHGGNEDLDLANQESEGDGIPGTGSDVGSTGLIINLWHCKIFEDCRKSCYN